MTTTRLEAFSDGVIAILITIMILELKVPEGPGTWEQIQKVDLVHKLLLYVLSYVYLGIYWSNHHHMLHATEHVNGKILWANLHLLFWLSLVPFATAWMGSSGNAPIPTATYGVILLCAGQAYTMLQNAIIKLEGRDSLLATAVGRDKKGLISRILYVAAIGAAFISPWISDGLYVTVALMWLVPDRRIESTLHH
ncbi:MAG TPA: TMEM175 family protein [Vicinamibacterales bacterium]|nr:TMEM175 family protein [Vicinamibacterales bacterium]